MGNDRGISIFESSSMSWWVLLQWSVGETLASMPSCTAEAMQLEQNLFPTLRSRGIAQGSILLQNRVCSAGIFAAIGQ